MIKIQNLNKIYRTGFMMKPKVALKNISLNVQEGDIYGFIGPNGAGKSTTIKILSGLLRFKEGSVQVLGGSPQDTEIRKQMGYCPEHPYFYDDLSGWELLEFYGHMSGFSGADLKKRIHKALETLHADQEWVHSKLRRYSKGMVQRIGIAQAILSEPKLLILDEPMSGLDPLGRKDVREAILKLNQQGTTIFYSSHVLGDVEAISSKIGMIIGGEIRNEGSVAEILHQTKSEYDVQLNRSFSPEELPFSELSVTLHKKIHCPSEISKDRFIDWALQNSFKIETVEKSRASLEDVLTREIANVR